MKNYVFVFFALFSCASIQKPTDNVVVSKPKLVFEALNHDMIKTIHLSRQALQNVETIRIENEISILTRVKKKQSKRKFIRDLQKMDFESAMHHVRKLNEKELLKLATTVEKVGCTGNFNVNYAIASFAERFYFDPVFKDVALDNYEKVFRCGVGHLKEAAAYRMALLNVLNENCPESLKYSKFLIENSKPRAIQSRAHYWNSFCNGFRTVNPPVAVYSSLPMTYHSLLLLENAGDDTHLKAAKSTQATQVVTNSRNPELNNWLFYIEKSYLDNNLGALKRALLAIRNSPDFSSEPGIYTYLMFFSKNVDDYLGTFNFASRAINLDSKMKNKELMNELFPRPYLDFITRNAKKYGIDEYLLLSLIRQESGFHPDAKSRVGAMGLMQIMYPTARQLNRGVKRSQLNQVEVNLDLGSKYFNQLLEKYKGERRLALAAYNAGPAMVDSWLKRYRTDNLSLLVDLIPFQETREYVGSIERNYFWYTVLYQSSPLKMSEFDATTPK